MKIARISIEFLLDEGTAVEEFMSRLLSKASPVTIEHTPLQPATQIADANVAAETGSRRRRASPGPAGVPPISDAPVQSVTTESRRRRAPAAAPAAPAAPEAPQGISDADMTKAASNTADVLVNLGEDGPGIVMLVLKDFEVTSVGDVPVEKRHDVLSEFAKEITLAKADKEMAP